MADNRTVYHCFVAQTREEQQIEVVRWLRDDAANFKLVWVEHYADKKPPDTVKPEQLEENESDIHQYSESGLVLPHIHGLVKLPKRQSPESLTSSFAGYVHFQRCSNPHRYLQYMLHRDFKSSFDPNKHQYNFDELQTNDTAFLATLSTPIEDSDIMLRWCDYLERCSGSISAAMALAVSESDFVLVREIKVHSYFYYRFFGG